MTSPTKEAVAREPFSRDDAELALAVLVEPLARGARVLWVGEPGAGAERLADTAGSIESTAGLRRTRNARRGGRVRARGWPQNGEIFDLVIASEIDLGNDGPSRILELSRIVEVGGALVVAIEASSTEAYAQLHEALSRSFSSVRMLGQTRFTGFAHVDFARADGSDLAFDGSALAGVEPPIRWIAIAGAAERGVEPYLVVQTASVDGERAPVAAAPAPAAPSHAHGLEQQIEASRARLEHSEKRLEQAQREIARNGQKLDELRHQLEQSQSALASRDRELSAKNAQLAERASADPAQIAELEDAYDELEERLRGQGSELTALRLELDRRATLVRDLVEELRTARAASVARPSTAPAAGSSPDALPELDRLRAQIAGLQRRLADAEGERAAASFRADELSAQLQRFKQAPSGQPPAVVLEQIRADAEARIAASTAAYGAERAALRSEASTLAAEATSLRSQVASLGTEVASLRARLGSHGSEWASERDALQRAHAEAEGRVRGWMARVAELDELRALAEARLALTEDDLRRAKDRARTLERELEDAREQFAVARMRPPESGTHAVAAVASEPDHADARREGELLGALHRAREALAAAQDERSSLSRELSRARTGLLAAQQEAEAAREGASQLSAQQRSELELLRASDATARAALVELREAHEARLTTIDALEGERSGLRMRLSDAEAALEAARHAPSPTSEAQLAALLAERDALIAERDALAAAAEEGRVLRAKLLEGSTAEGADATMGDGEALDVAHQVAMLDAERAEARKIGILLGDVERDLEALRRERDAEAAAARQAREALAQSEAGERARMAGHLERVAARDALVARLQSVVAAAETARRASHEELRSMEARLLRAEEAGTALEVARDVQRAEESRERAALADAAVSARAAADALASSRERGLSVLGDIRGALASLIEGIKSPPAGTPESSLRDENVALQRELDDRGLMLRSLTAQLEERDERLRSFETGGAALALKALESRLREAEEKETRLVRELELAAERRTAAMEREAELRRLEQLLEARDAQVMAGEGQIEQSQRSQAQLRDQLARVGSELESVLGHAKNESPSATLERIGEILRAIRR